MSDTGTWIGRSVSRREDRALLTGAARFIDDLSPVAGICHAAILRSPHAHAEIRSVDISALEGAPGVVGVLTGADVGSMSRPLGNLIRSAPAYYPCAIDRVRYVGEPVAVVVADSRYTAEDALERIVVDYAVLEAVTDPERAAATDAPKIHDVDGGNVLHRRTFSYGDPQRAFADADEIVEVTTRLPRVNSTPMECYGLVAHHESEPDRYTVWSNFQGPFTLHPMMSMALGVPSACLRLVSPPASGGSFGIKQAIYPYAVLMALASRKLGVPVKWTEDRVEHLAASSSSTGRVCRMRGAFAKDGELLGLDISNLDDVGAYLRAPEPASTYRMHGTLNGPYRVRNIAIENRIVVTNTLPNGLNRGFGAPQHFYPLERLMDVAAARLELDVVAIRRRNLVPANAFPYACPSGSILDSGDYEACLERLLERTGYETLLRRREEARKEGRLFGIGLALAVETSGSNMGYVTLALTPQERARSSPKSGGPAAATVSFDPLGGVTIQIDSTPNGQGHATGASQVAAEILGMDPDAVNVLTQLDTATGAWSITSGNYANRFSTAVLPAIAKAAEAVAGELRILAAGHLGCAPADVRLADGMATAPDVSNRSLPIAKLAAETHWNSSNLPEGVVPALRATRTVWQPGLKEPDEADTIPSSITYSFMCDLVAVEVDRDTGRIEIQSYGTVHDVGRVINPALVEGQVRGGFAQGLGAAMYERIAYAPGGALLSGTFAEYLCPTAPEIPPLSIDHLESPSPNTPLGAKGSGDGPTLTVPVAIANALADATGIQDLAPPFTPGRVWNLLNGIDPDPALRPLAGGTGEDGEIDAAGPLRGEGRVKLAAPPERVWKQLFDADGLREIIPGCRSVEEVEPGVFDASVRISVAGIGAVYGARLEIADAREPHFARLRGRAESRLGHGSGEAIVRLAAEGDATMLDYRYAATVGGPVAGVGGRLLDGAAKLLIAEFFEELQAVLSGTGRTPMWRRLLRRLLPRREGTRP
ncbi:MAG: molybdopterin cofactor-binding domain-containing protein [Flavobacteriaceae bacterium]